jgi:peptidoglycan-associated lipoprotein
LYIIIAGKKILAVKLLSFTGGRIMHINLGSFAAALSIAALPLSGCSSSTADKGQAPAGPAASASVSRQASKANPAGAVAPRPPSSSSLDAHKQGVAPGSGPLKEIFFTFDQAELTEQARATLRDNVAWLKANPSARIEIEGHCDERGTTEYNIALGARRAGAARDYLLSLGIAGGRISTTSFGEELAVCKAMTEECYEKNRRDHFVVLRSGPTF